MSHVADEDAACMGNEMKYVNADHVKIWTLTLFVALGRKYEMPWYLPSVSCCMCGFYRPTDELEGDDEVSGRSWDDPIPVRSHLQYDGMTLSSEVATITPLRRSVSTNDAAISRRSLEISGKQI
ncbi:hypothetical protein E4U55_005589 [Claviceps digitariae]|nr:hypothetical protein E4U55_005589 [Claviceps digitariae]